MKRKEGKNPLPRYGLQLAHVEGFFDFVSVLYLALVQEMRAWTKESNPAGFRFESIWPNILKRLWARVVLSSECP